MRFRRYDCFVFLFCLLWLTTVSCVWCCNLQGVFTLQPDIYVIGHQRANFFSDNTKLEFREQPAALTVDQYQIVRTKASFPCRVFSLHTSVPPPLLPLALPRV